MKIGKILTKDSKGFLDIAKRMDLRHNVQIRVLDGTTLEPISVHEGHNAATNTMMLGIAHYLTGDGVLNQGWDVLRDFIPRYISLGTMGLVNQEQDDEGLPAGIGTYLNPDVMFPDEYDAYIEGDKGPLEKLQFEEYMRQVPGYGADGYDGLLNNNREHFGLGPAFDLRSRVKHIYPEQDVPAGHPEGWCEVCGMVHPCQVKDGEQSEHPVSNQYIAPTINCELVDNLYRRSEISYREIVPESMAEIPETIDVVFSAMISVGALAKFRESDKDYIFITEAGLWSTPTYNEMSPGNGLLAAYRIAPPDTDHWDMSSEDNRRRLKKQIIKVHKNQVVQVIWKIQLGSVKQIDGTGIPRGLRWILYDEWGGYGDLQPWPGWQGPYDPAPHEHELKWIER